jgi:hypothetical protein
VTFTRARTFAVALILSILTMMTAPLFAAAAHDVCDAMDHGCAKIDALACCCSDRSDSKPSQIPSDRTAATDSMHSVAVVGSAFHVPAVPVSLAHEGRPPLARPPDFRILFSDLRI